MLAALDQVYTAELPAVYGFLVRAGAERSQLEDLAHDVFVTAMRKWSTYDQTRPVRPWLLGIAHRTLLDIRRRPSTRREVVGPVPDVIDEGETGEDRVKSRQAQALVQLALESMDGERRRTFVLCELQGLTPNEVAEVMETPVATTYSRLRVAREEFGAAVRRIQLQRGET